MLRSDIVFCHNKKIWVGVFFVEFCFVQNVPTFNFAKTHPWHWFIHNVEFKILYVFFGRVKGKLMINCISSEGTSPEAFRSHELKPSRFAIHNYPVIFGK